DCSLPSPHRKEIERMRPNRLRELLRAGKPTLGTHVHSAWPATIELVGHSGLFDYVEFAGEYAPYDLFALENLARAVDTFPHMSAMMKVEQQPVVEAERRMIKTALVLGIAPRAEISRPEQAKPYLDLGVRHFCMGWDVEILFDWFKREGEAMRKILEGG